MADEIDMAQFHIERFLVDSIANMTRAIVGPAPVDIDAVLCCVECEGPIPLARLAAVPGVGLCVVCKGERES